MVKSKKQTKKYKYFQRAGADAVLTPSPLSVATQGNSAVLNLPYQNPSTSSTPGIPSSSSTSTNIAILQRQQSANSVYEPKQLGGRKRSRSRTRKLRKRKSKKRKLRKN